MVLSRKQNPNEGRVYGTGTVFTDVGGVLGNKCDTCIFFQRSIYPRMAAASFYVTMVGVTPTGPS